MGLVIGKRYLHLCSAVDVEFFGVDSGAYLGGMVPCPLGRQDSIICVELYAKVRHGPPPLQLGKKILAHKRTKSQ